MTTELRSAWIAVSAGISPSMVMNVAIQWLSMVLLTFKQTTAKQTPTYTEQLRLEDITRGSPKEPYEWASMSETAQDLKVLMLTPDGTQLPVS